MNVSPSEQPMTNSYCFSIRPSTFLLLSFCFLISYVVQFLPFSYLLNSISLASIALYFFGSISFKTRVQSIFILFLPLIVLHILLSYPTYLSSQKLILHILYSSTFGFILHVSLLSALWLLIALVFIISFFSVFVCMLSRHVSIYTTLSPSNFSPIFSSILSTFDLHYSSETNRIVRNISREPKPISVLLFSIFVNDVVISITLPMTAYFLCPSSESLLHMIPHNSSKYSIPAIIILGAAGGFGVSFSRHILPQFYDRTLETWTWKEVIYGMNDVASCFLLEIMSHLLMSVTVAGGKTGMNKFTILQASGIIAAIGYLIAVLRSLRKHCQNRGNYAESVMVFELLIRYVVLYSFSSMCFTETQFVIDNT